jgi:hypothetical protein
LIESSEKDSSMYQYDNTDERSGIKKLDMEINAMKVCITKKDDFTNKYSFIFEDYDISTGLKIGRLYKARRRLTEIVNGDVGTTERIPESRVVFDYYINPNKISFLSKDIGCVSYEALKPTFIGKRIKYPMVNDRLMLVSLNTNLADKDSVREFQCQVCNIYPFCIKYDPESNEYSRSYSLSMGTIEVVVDHQQSMLQRSIVLPPKIPKYKQIDTMII